MTTVATFNIDYRQYLDQHGQLVNSNLPAFARDPQELVKMYRLMVQTRVFDTKAIRLQRTGKLGTYASCLGHEASHVGVGSAMHKDDVYAPLLSRLRHAVLAWSRNEGCSPLLGWR